MGVVSLAVAILLGLLLLALGLRVRRRGETPFCGRCGYNLTGRASDVCPECGSNLSAAGAVVQGTAHRRRGLIVAGGLLLAVAAAFVIATLADVDWYRFRPTTWVIRDTQSRNVSNTSRAWDELDRRERAGKLTDAHYRQLVDVYLRQQTWPSDKKNAHWPKLSEYVSRAYAAGLFTEAQRRQFFEQMIEGTFEVRPRTSPHDPVPARLKHTVHNGVLPVACTLFVRDLRLDGKPLDVEVSSAFESFSRSTGHNNIPVGKASPGKHELTGTLHVAIYSADRQPDRSTSIGFHRAREWSKQPCYHQADIPLRADFEVLSEEPPDYIRKVASDEVERIVKRCYYNIGIILRRDRSGRCRIGGSSLATSGPAEPLLVTVAGDLYLRLDGREFPMGEAIGRKGEQDCHYPIRGEFEYTGPAVTKAQIVLRGNEKLARESVDLYEFWEGEVVHENVTLEWDRDDYQPVATRPGS